MVIFSLSGLSESSLEGSNGTPSISKVSSEISIGKRCTGPKCLLIDSIRSVVHGKKKYILENWVSKAPDSYCILCLLKKVSKNYLVYAFYDGNEEFLILFWTSIVQEMLISISTDRDVSKWFIKTLTITCYWIVMGEKHLQFPVLKLVGIKIFRWVQAPMYLPDKEIIPIIYLLLSL